ncbi:hypothetical protein Kfla_4660 [Kribbella flavida DSM 17836]|uniref:AbiEi antitoxin N-terminal domain-containing protein n=1 Tax=Kribbella flavida (strain DSM 17836 / JCM 10339 / NBRC 14399) TaxID=479435 RepID=D2PZ69_KRIFD|nr:type IV toxin-antitoxin system AbiEi family antitoxin domain-containing protein [Kribbella flavida]ADB33678.1 hypothetical protein Kfla_4660 [Kribbella flavida DSM 17836]
MAGRRRLEQVHIKGVNRQLAAIAARRGGWFDRTDAVAAGYSDAEISERVRAGRWTRVRRGAYAEVGSADESLPPWERAAWLHVRAAKAYFHRLGGRAVVSHQSALLLHGLQISEVDLSRVHVTRRAGPGRSGRTLCQHAAQPPVTEVATIDDTQVTSAPRAVVEAIRSVPYPTAVSVVDAALRGGLADRDQLREMLRRFGRQRGVRTAQRALAFGDGRSESVGESRMRVLLADLGLPPAVPQAVIVDRSGTFVARVDLLLREWNVVIEFDGVGKYDSRQALVAEKLREDQLRDLGYQVVRATWTDLDDPTTFVARLSRAIHRSTQQPLARVTPPTTTDAVHGSSDETPVHS